jgi:hypothetical protein
MAGWLLSLAENYNRTSTDLTAESQSAQRLHAEVFGAVFGLDDPCGLWASLARQPIDRAVSLHRFHGSRSRVSHPWAGPSGLHRSLAGGHSC